MYAIVTIAGQQYKVEKDQKIFVHRLEGEEGQIVQFDEVLLIDNDKEVMVGMPTLKGASITGKVLSHPKGDKIQVFKKKKRKGYRVLRGHRQFMTEIQIQDIIEKGAVKESRTAEETKIKTRAEGKPGAVKKEKAEPRTAPAAETQLKAGTEKGTETGAAKAAVETAKGKSAAAGAAGKQKTPAKKESAKKTSTRKESPGTKTAVKPVAKKSSGTTQKKPSAGKTDKK
jgi:large subunit ribosomal protein L21